MENFTGFAKYLYDNNIMSEGDIKRVLNSGNSFTEEIYNNKYILENTLAVAIARYNKNCYIDLSHFNIDIVIDKQNYIWNKQNNIVPLMLKDNCLYVALDNPINTAKAFSYLKNEYNVDKIIPFICERHKIIRFIDSLIMLSENKKNTIINNENKMNFETTNTKNISEPDNNEERKHVVSEKIRSESKKGNNSEDNKEKVISKFIQRVLISAINSDVDEIHFEPHNKSYRIRFKQYGEYYQSFVPPQEIKNDLSRKIKEITNLSQTTKTPQRGNLTLKLSDVKSVDFKVSICPLVYGDKIVLKIMDDSISRLSFDNLGYTVEDRLNITKSLEKSEGVYFFTGPVNSGKTYSMYNILNHFNSTTKNIYALEPNVGFNLPGVNQLKINSDFSYIEGLEIAHEQSADIILIDNVSNPEVLKKVFEVAGNGRLIVCGMNTLNNTDTFKYIQHSRINNLEQGLSFKGIISQRLLPKLCEDCKKNDILTKAVLSSIGLTEQHLFGFNVNWHPQISTGCIKCNESGVKGSVAIYEITLFNEIAKELFFENKIDELYEYINKNITPLKDQAIDKFKEGIISVNTLKSI